MLGWAMKTVEPTLRERAGLMYRRLLLLQRLFPVPHDVGRRGHDDTAEEPALDAAVGEVIGELTGHARALTSVPFPLSEWRPGDGPDDERWRALTEIERREVLSLLAGYDSLIAWGEDMARGQRDALEYLRAERARVGRFRQDMGFLERRRAAG
jgi:hypothetical protein